VPPAWFGWWFLQLISRLKVICCKKNIVPWLISQDDKFKRTSLPNTLACHLHAGRWRLTTLLSKQKKTTDDSHSVHLGHWFVQASTLSPH
jgi:hypothetical protein